MGKIRRRHTAVSRVRLDPPHLSRLAVQRLGFNLPLNAVALGLVFGTLFTHQVLWHIITKTLLPAQICANREDCCDKGTSRSPANRRNIHCVCNSLALGNGDPVIGAYECRNSPPLPYLDTNAI